MNATGGTSLTGSYNATPTVNTCQYSCSSGYTWSAGSCIANPGTIYATDGSSSVYVINASTNTVTNTITVGSGPYGIAVNKTTNTIYVNNCNANTVSVINGATNTVTATIPVGS